MSVIEQLRSIIGSESDTDTREYECSECGNTFVSMKDPERATCMECLSGDVTAVE